MQTVFKYNLEFINNKHYSIRPSSSSSTVQTPSSSSSLSSQHINHVGRVQDDVADSAKPTIVDNRITLDKKKGLLGYSDRLADAALANSTWWSSAASEWWRRWSGGGGDTTTSDDGSGRRAGRDGDRRAKANTSSTGGRLMGNGDGGGGRKAIDEQITGPLGETYEICRPCTDVEMAHAFCSSDIGKRLFNLLV